jgi:predicted RNase H-like HicB family nuclease
MRVLKRKDTSVLTGNQGENKWLTLIQNANKDKYEIDELSNVMSEDQIIPVSLEFTLRYTTGRTGLFVGFIREFPFITGQAKTLEDLSAQLYTDLTLYFKTFPEGQQKLLKHGKVINSELNIYSEKPPPLEIKRPELGEGWIEKRDEKVMMATH